MSQFKEKTIKKKKDLKINKTIDAIHNDFMDSLNLEKLNLKKYNDTLLELKNKIRSLENIGLSNCNDDELMNYKEYKYEVKQLEKKIKSIENNEEEKEYYTKTAPLLFYYYEKNDSNSKESREEECKNVMNFFKKEEKIEDNKDKYEDMDKSNIIKEYLYKTNNEILDKDNYVKKIDINICEVCKIEKKIIQSEGILVCDNCGLTNSILIDAEKPSYKEPPKEIVYFAYKRINHFNEWLAQFQAKESTDIPKEVFDKIILELKKERIENIAGITNIKLRSILKKLKLNKYYEHIPHIINRLNGLPPRCMSNEMEQKLRQMFKEIQLPWIKHCPENRKNFLSYSYVLHKFCELLEYDDFLESFPLLKSREKLHQQDLIWKNICEYLNWQFIKSI